MFPQRFHQTFGGKIKENHWFFLIIPIVKVAFGAVKAGVDAVRADVDAGSDVADRRVAL